MATIQTLTGTCALNSKQVEQTTYRGLTPDGTTITTFGLLYTNSDTSTNNGVQALTVGLICDPNAKSPIYGTLKTNDGGVTYQTTLTSDVVCPVFTSSELT